MSDVIWAALLAVAGSGITGLIGYLTALRNAGVQENAALTQAKVVLAKVDAENERLRQQYREDERRNRQGTYHRFLATLDRFDLLATGFAQSDADFRVVLAEYNYGIGAIRLFGAEEAAEPLRRLANVFAAIGENLGLADDGAATRFAEAYQRHRTDVQTAERALIEVMRLDVTGGVLPSPQASREP
jgi:hypothetical protein